MGSRVRNVMAELHGEKIDIVDYSDDPACFVGNALSPARVTAVHVIDAEARVAQVTVPDYQLSLAIGKEGQNARLAARLTGWRIDIRSDAQPEGPSAKPRTWPPNLTGPGGTAARAARRRPNPPAPQTLRHGRVTSGNGRAVGRPARQRASGAHLRGLPAARGQVQLAPPGGGRGRDRFPTQERACLAGVRTCTRVRDALSLRSAGGRWYAPCARPAPSVPPRSRSISAQ